MIFMQLFLNVLTMACVSLNWMKEGGRSIKNKSPQAGECKEVKYESQATTKQGKPTNLDMPI